MRQGYQYSQRHLPRLPLFLMLLVAFVDCSTGKVAKAQPTPISPRIRGCEDRTRRPIRGPRESGWQGELGAADWDNPSPQTAPDRGNPARPSPTPLLPYIRFAPADQDFSPDPAGRPIASTTGSTERTLSRVSPFTVGGRETGKWSAARGGWSRRTAPGRRPLSLGKETRSC
jgi:hypothetical protein